MAELQERLRPRQEQQRPRIRPFANDRGRNRGHVVPFLAGEESRWLTGQTIRAGGGIVM